MTGAAEFVCRAAAAASGSGEGHPCREGTGGPTSPATGQKERRSSSASAGRGGGGGRGWRGVTCRCGVCRAQLRQDKTTRNKKKEKREGPRKCADSERIVSHHPFTTCYTPRSLLLHSARYCTSTIGTASSSSSTPRPIIALSRWWRHIAPFIIRALLFFSLKFPSFRKKKARRRRRQKRQKSHRQPTSFHLMTLAAAAAEIKDIWVA